MADEIIPVEKVRDQLSAKLNIKLDSGTVGPDDVDSLMEIARNYPGRCNLIFHLPNNGNIKPIRVLAHNIKVSTKKEFIRRLRYKYGKDNIWVE